MEDVRLRKAIKAMLDAYIQHIKNTEDEIVGKIYAAVKATEQYTEKRGIDFSQEKNAIISEMEEASKRPSRYTAHVSLHIAALSILPIYNPYIFNAALRNLSLFASTIGGIIDTIMLNKMKDPDTIRLLLDPLAVAKTHETLTTLYVASLAEKKEGGDSG